MKSHTEKDIHAPVAPIGRSHHVASWVLMGMTLLGVLYLHLLAAMLAGLLVFQLVHMLSSAIRIPYIGKYNAKVLFVFVLAVIVVVALTFAGIGISVFLRKGPDNLSTMMTSMAVIMEDLRRVLPESVVGYLPTDADNAKRIIAEWFRVHATDIRSFGTGTLRAFAHVLIGLIIGAMVALHEATPHVRPSPFVRAVTLRLRYLSDTFRRVMLAQVPISAINTLLTAIYLLVVLPNLGLMLPFTKTLIVVTFLAGLLPVIGNLISNTAIFLVSLSISFTVAASSLAYLIVIHKLEYFLNARIVGVRINAKAWELLISMLVLESAFGIQGLVIAPLLYAYIKRELGERGLL
jgi:predicted PurR-regulated permease PerM